MVRTFGEMHHVMFPEVGDDQVGNRPTVERCRSLLSDAINPPSTKGVSPTRHNGLRVSSISTSAQAMVPNRILPRRNRVLGRWRDGH